MGDAANYFDQFMGMQGRLSSAQAIGDQQEEGGGPDKAARALELGRITGEDPSIIYQNLDEYQQDQHSRATTEIIQGNPQLQQYIQANPMHSKVSSDDWGNLDAVSRNQSYLNGPKDVSPDNQQPWPGLDQWVGGLISYIHNNTQHFSDLQKEEVRQGQALGGLSGYGSATVHALMGAASQLIAETTDFSGQGEMYQLMKKQYDGTITEEERLKLAEDIGLGFVGEGVKEAKPKITPPGPEGGLPKPEVDPNAERINNAADVVDAVKPWADANENPPMGIHPEIDKLHIEQARQDAAAMDQFLTDIERTKTKGRSSEAIEKFLQLRPDATVEIHSEGVRLLYGDERIPDNTDAKLGWISDIGDQVQAVRDTSGATSVQVPLSTFLAHIDKDTFQELKDHISMSPGAPSLFEIKDEDLRTQIAETQKARGDYTLHDVSAPEREPKEFEPLTEGEYDERAPFGWDFAEPQLGEKVFEIRGPSGRSIGTIHVGSPDGGQTIRVHDIASVAINKLGAGAVRGLLDQLRDAYPDAKRIEGFRVTGARKRADVVEARGEAAVKLPSYWQRTVQRMRDWAISKPIDPAHSSVNFVRRGARSEKFTVRDDTTGQDITTSSIATLKVKDILPRLSTHLLKDSQQALHQFIVDQFTAAVGDMPVHVVTKDFMDRTQRRQVGEERFGDIPGFHHRGQIVVREDFVNGTVPAWSQTYLFIHEITHGFTVPALVRNPELMNAVQMMLDDVKFRLDEAERLNKDILPNISAKAARKLLDYALQNPLEFYAEGFGHDVIRRLLSGIKLRPETVAGHEALLGKYKGMGPIGSAWNAVTRMFRALIKRTFNHDISDTAFEGLMKMGEIVEKTNNIMENMKSVAAERIDLAPNLGRVGNIVDRLATKLKPRQFRQYEYQIEKQRERDRQASIQYEIARERRKQSQEYKDNRANVLEEARHRVTERSDIAAERFFGENNLYGTRVRPHKIDSIGVPAELRARLPKQWLAREGEGIHPADAAQIFGFPDGQTMLESLANLIEQRNLEGLSRARHITQLTNAMADQIMRERYGDIEQNILNQALAHITEQNDLDVAFAENLDAAIRAGTGTLDRKSIEAGLTKKFEHMTVGKLKVSKFMAAAARAMERVRNAHLVDDVKTAFQFEQGHYNSLFFAKLSKGPERDLRYLDKFGKKYRKRSFSTIDQDFVNRIHQLLGKMGYPYHNPLDLRARMAKDGRTLEQFVNHYDNPPWKELLPDVLQAEFSGLPIPDWLFDEQYSRKPAQMTPSELRANLDAIRALEIAGRLEKSTIVGEERRRVQDVFRQVTHAVEGALHGLVRLTPARSAALSQPGHGLGHLLRSFDASLRPVVDFVDRIGRGDPDAIFERAVVRPIMTGLNNRRAMIKKYMKAYDAILKKYPIQKARLKQTIAGLKIRDPVMAGPGAHPDETLRDMTYEEALGAIQHLGNGSNAKKFFEGYKYKQHEIVPFYKALFKATTKADWDRAQEIGKLTKEVFDQAAEVRHRVIGIAPEEIQLNPFQTPWGEYEGWYNKLVYDPYRRWEPGERGQSAKPYGFTALEDGSFYRAATPNGYTKKRTSYTAPLLLTNSHIWYGIDQMINDATMFEAVRDAGKIIYHPQFKGMIARNAGKEIADLFDPWLKDVAGQKTYKEAVQQTAERIFSGVLKNLINVLVGGNPLTAAKHGLSAAALSIKAVGAREFGSHFLNMFGRDEEKGNRNLFWALHGGKAVLNDGTVIDFEGSQELQGRINHWASDTGSDMFRPRSTYTKVRDIVQMIGTSHIAGLDLASAIPTWLATYEKYRDLGWEHGDAVYAADKMVRKAHGSTLIGARPAILRGNALLRGLVPFYNFFNRVYNGYYELAWRSRDTLGYARAGDWDKFRSQLGPLGAGFFAYVIAPAIVEQLVSPPQRSKNETTAEYYSEVGLRSMFMSIPILRDIVEDTIEGYDPVIGLYSTAPKELYTLLRDLKKPHMGMDRAHAGKTLRDVITTFGMLSGLTNAEEGRIVQYAYDYSHGLEHPRNLGGLIHGLIHGIDTFKPPRR